MQTGVAATHHAMLKRISMSAFVSLVPTALLTRALWFFPTVPVCLSFVGLAPYKLPHLGNSKGMLCWVNLRQDPEFCMAYRVALCICFLFLPASHCLHSSPSLGRGEHPLCLGALSVFGGGPDFALSVGMYGGIGAWSDGLINNQSINEYSFKVLMLDY